MKKVLVAAALAVLSILPLPAAGQDFLQREVHIYAGFGPGSQPDLMARFLAGKLRPFINKPVVVENKVGAGGNIATRALMTARPDGHTLLFSTGGPAAHNVHLFKSLGYDPLTLTPVTLVATTPYLLLVNPKRGYNSVADLMSDLRRRGKASFGANGAVGMVLGELAKTSAKIDAVQVLYRENGPMLNDLLGDNIDFAFLDLGISLAQVNDGRIKALAVASAQRTALAPQFSTFVDAGFPDVVLEGWVAIFLPPGTPQPIVTAFSGWFQKILATDEAKQFFRNAGAEVKPGTPDDLRRLQIESMAKWGTYVKLVGIEAQ